MTDPKPLTRDEVGKIDFAAAAAEEGEQWFEDIRRLCADWLRMEAEIMDNEEHWSTEARHFQKLYEAEKAEVARLRGALLEIGAHHFISETCRVVVEQALHGEKP